MSHPTKMNSWQKLIGLSKSLPKEKDLKSEDYQTASGAIAIDYSGQRINRSIFNALMELAQESDLQAHIQALFTGKSVNNTENRPALHTALRAAKQEHIQVNNKNVVADVVAAQQMMEEITAKVRSGEWKGYSGKAITDVVNMGIGGSMLGPFFCMDALSDYVTEALNFHFIAEIDPNAFPRLTAKLNPETTLFIISSKSFTTPETLHNMEQAKNWINQPSHFNQHFIAVTANIEKAREAGFQHILPIWDWIGGRYSVCSAINLITSIAIGFEHFSALLEGARMMDTHFQTAEFTNNLPVILALLGIWNINFLQYHNLLILTYAEDLEYFVPYLQQLDMESNGKSINKQGQLIDYKTGPIVWGGPGNHAQHSYYQLLCQGTHKIAADLISVKAFDGKGINKMCLGHRQVLIHGADAEENPHSYIPGETPVNHVSLNDCSPQSLGSLIALYEHKVFVQGVIWNINSFDQPGVESAKKIFKKYA